MLTNKTKFKTISKHFQWGTAKSPYDSTSNSDLDPCDFFLFPCMRDDIKGFRLQSARDQKGVRKFYDKGY